MRRYWHVILLVLIIMLVYFSWTLNKTKPLDHVPEKANLVLNYDSNNLIINKRKDDINVRNQLL